MMQFDLFTHPLFSNLRAKWFYRRGMVHAKLHRNELAIADYTRVIEMTAASADIRAKALYNRALVYHATLNLSKSIDDLNIVLEMAGATAQVRTEARRKLVRMERNSHRSDSRGPTATSSSEEEKNASTKPKTARRRKD